MAFSPDGCRIVSAAADKTVRVWDAVTGAALHCLNGHTDEVWSVAFSPDGRRIASGAGRTVRYRLVTDSHPFEGSSEWQRKDAPCKDFAVRIWDAITGAELPCHSGHVDGVTSVAYSADGSFLVSGSFDNTVRVWDPNKRTKVLTLRGHEAQVRSLAFSDDGRRIASCASDKTVRIWNANTGAELLTLKHPFGSYEVKSVAFSPDGRRVAGAGLESIVWDAITGTALPLNHLGSSDTITFSPDVRYILVKERGERRLYDQATGAPIATEYDDGDYRPWEAKTDFFTALDESLAACAKPLTLRALVPRAPISPSGHSVDLEVQLLLGEARLPRGLETVVESTATGQQTAVFPVALSDIVTHELSRTWAGSVSNHVYIIAFEGEAPV